MSKQKKELFDKVYTLVDRLNVTPETIEEIISAVLASELNEAVKPVMKYGLEFYDYNGEFKHRKETDYNYRVGNLIDYEHVRWVVRVAFTCEDEGQFRVTFQADQIRED